MSKSQCNSHRDLWLFMAGAAFAAGRRSREEILGLVDVQEAPADILVLLTALTEHSRSPVLEWLGQRGVSLGNGEDIFDAVAAAVREMGRQAALRRVKTRLSVCGLDTAEELIEFLESQSAELRRKFS